MLVAYFFVLGLIIGSFANAVVWRIHTKRSFIKGRSICPHCKKQIRNYDLFPVLSWIILRGKCRDCRKPISIQYPAVELLTGIVFALIWLALRPSTAISWVNFGFWLYLAGSLIILAVYDLKWMILPDVIMVPAITVAALHLLVQPILGQPFTIIRGPIIAAVAIGGLFYLLASVSKGKWMGGGDIKLVFLIGLALGIQKTLLTLFIASGSAALIGGVMMVTTKKIKNHIIPFGPFLAAATLIALLYGHQMIQAYLNFSGISSLTKF